MGKNILRCDVFNGNSDTASCFISSEINFNVSEYIYNTNFGVPLSFNQGESVLLSIDVENEGSQCNSLF